MNNTLVNLDDFIESFITEVSFTNLITTNNSLVANYIIHNNGYDYLSSSVLIKLLIKNDLLKGINSISLEELLYYLETLDFDLFINSKISGNESDLLMSYLYFQEYCNIKDGDTSIIEILIRGQYKGYYNLYYSIITNLINYIKLKI